MPIEQNGRSLTDVPAGKIAAVVTHLQMFARPERRSGGPQPADLSVIRMPKPDLAWYRGLYRAVGEEWLWYSRLAMHDAELATIIQDPGVEIYRLVRGSADIGLLELDFRQPPDVELVLSLIHI